MNDKVIEQLCEHLGADGKKCYKQVHIDSAKQVYYALGLSDKQYRLEFWIDTYANKRALLQSELQKIFSSKKEYQRDYSLGAYYSARGICCRRSAITIEDLKEDYSKLKELLGPIEEVVCKADNPEMGYPPVGIGEISVSDLLGRSFVIPDYQRPYCWSAKNIEGLLKDLSNWYSKHKEDGKKYHLGSIILKRRNDNKGEVIDGQQRLITLALLEATRNPDKKVDILLGSNNETKAALDAISKAKGTIAVWKNKLNLAQVVVSIIEIAEEESDDLAFNFFNHLNSSGVPLTDYELLKGHHLRFVKEDVVAEIMAARWHALDTGRVDRLKERLLHKCLFRIRKWLAHEWFEWDADELETHSLFHEFTLGFEIPYELCTSYKAVSIDSMLSGGLEFFDYVNRYRMMFEQFIRQESIRAIAPLQWRSNGVLHDAIVALAFQFYCKFGDVYLKDAVYAIAWNVSALRAEMGQVRRSHLGDKPVFRDAAMAIARATHESEAIGKLLDKEQLPIDVQAPGELGYYWGVLKTCAAQLEGEETVLLHTHYLCTFEPVQTKRQK